MKEHTEEKNTLSLREKLGVWVENPGVQKFTVALILINAVTIGLDTNQATHVLSGTWFELLDEFILVVFVLELLIRLYAFGFSFFKETWNIFDLVIVVFSLLPASGVFAVMRTLRILRTLRLLRKIPKLRLIIDALVKAIPSIGWVGALLGLVFYVSSVIATNLFSEDFPQWFGGLGRTMYTLFQVMTLEGWSMDIARPVMAKQPYSVLFFIPFILIATYTALNIFMAVVVNAMNEINRGEQEEESLKVPRGQQPFLINDSYILEQKLELLEGEMKEIKKLLLEIHNEKITR